MQHAIPRFPVLSSHGEPQELSSIFVAAWRALNERALESEVRALAGDASALRRLVLASVGLASLERTGGRCASAEAALHRAMSVCMHLAVGHGDLFIDRTRAAECAEWCAEELAVLYAEHGLPAHADAVRRAARWASERVQPRVEA